ncbi:MAG: hypothetical protein LBL52_03660 [Rickettsiales bacterium]|jgi:hypothetical protein|nr:hypothetical protein [Rickettsiales bacterium]
MSSRITYIADGLSREFAFAFRIFSPADLCVEIDGERYSDFAIESLGTGGKAIFDVAPPTGSRVCLYRRLDFSRESAFSTGGVFRAEDLNTEIAYNRACAEQAYDASARSIKLGAGIAETCELELPRPQANLVLAWNADGTALVNRDVDLAEKVAYLEDLVATAEGIYSDLAGAFGSSLDAGAFGVVKNLISLVRGVIPESFIDLGQVADGADEPLDNGSITDDVLELQDLGQV